MLASLDLSKRKDAASLREVFKLAKELDLVVHKTERHELNLLSDDGLHQVGVAGGGKGMHEFEGHDLNEGSGDAAQQVETAAGHESGAA